MSFSYQDPVSLRSINVTSPEDFDAELHRFLHDASYVRATEDKLDNKAAFALDTRDYLASDRVEAVKALVAAAQSTELSSRIMITGAEEIDADDSWHAALRTLFAALAGVPDAYRLIPVAKVPVLFDLHFPAHVIVPALQMSSEHLAAIDPHHVRVEAEQLIMGFEMGEEFAGRIMEGHSIHLTFLDRLASGTRHDARLQQNLSFGVESGILRLIPPASTKLDLHDPRAVRLRYLAEMTEDATIKATVRHSLKLLGLDLPVTADTRVSTNADAASSTPIATPKRKIPSTPQAAQPSTPALSLQPRFRPANAVAAEIVRTNAASSGA